MSYTRLSQQHLLLEASILSPLAASSGNAPSRMSKGPKSTLMAALQSKADQMDQKNQQDLVAQELERCLSMSVEALGQEKVVSGKYNGRTIKEASEDPRYVMWLANHQAHNIKFVGLLNYNERTVGDQKTPKLSGGVPKGSGKESESHNIPQERILGMRWVLSWKAVEDSQGEVTGQKPKARLIIRGYQDPDLLYLKRDSPTLATQSRNMILAIAAAHGWQGFVGDIKTAFLNGDKTEAQREIYAEPPEEVRRMLNMKPYEIFRIMKAVYGLLHAPRAWADKLGKELQAQGWQQSRLEPCVWRLYGDDGTLCGLIGVHVDDVMCFGNGEVFANKVEALKRSFPFGSWKSLREATTFCGCELRQLEDDSIELNQECYSEGIMEIPVTKDRKEAPEEPATEDEKKNLRAALGALSWKATQSSPWLAASISYLQGCFKTAKVGDLMQTNKLIRMQRSLSQQVLVFPSNLKEPILLTYHDASYACRRDGSSQGGLFTMLVSRQVLEGQPCKYSPIAWQSRKLPRVCKSSTAAEIQTGSHSMDAHEFSKQTMLEWYNQQSIPARDMDNVLSQVTSVVVTDSKNLYDSVNRIETSGLQLEERRLALEVLSIRERSKAIGAQLRWVDSDQQLADNLSKPFTFTSLMNALQRGMICLQFDTQFMSSKKKRAWKRGQQNKTEPRETPQTDESHLEKSFHPC